MILDFINISPTKVHNRKGLAQLVFARDTVIVEDRRYFDFYLMMQRIRAENTFVKRIKSNTAFETLRELDLPNKEDQGILKDEVIILNGIF